MEQGGIFGTNAREPASGCAGSRARILDGDLRTEIRVRLATVAIALIAGAILGWGIAPFGRGGGSAAVAPPPAVPPAAGEIPESVPADPSAAEPSAEPSAESAGDPRAELERLLSRLPAKSWPSGEGAITGRVLRDEDGAPLAGIAIDAIIHGAPPGTEPKGLDSPDLLSYLREEIEQYRYDIAMARRAVTDAEGRFRLEGLHPDEEYHLHVAPSEEWVVFTKDRTSQLSPGSEVEYRAARCATVEVLAFDSAGSRVESGTVTIAIPSLGRDATLYVPFSSESPEIRVPVPSVSLTAYSAANWTSEEIEVHATPGERLVVRLVERKPVGLALTILAPEHIDRIGVWVVAEPIGGVPLGDDPRVRIRDARVRHAVVDESTGGTELDLEPGSYRLRVVRDNHLLAEREIFAGAVGIELTIPIPPRPTSEIAYIRIVGADGEPFAALDLDIVSRGPGDEGLEEMQSIWTEEIGLGAGRFAIIARDPLSPPGQGELAPPETYLVVGTELSGNARFPIRFGEPGEQVIRIPSPARLEVRILDYVGHALQGRIELDIGDPGRTFYDGQILSIDPVGNAIAERTIPGRRRLRFRRTTDSFDFGGITVLGEQEISVEPGMNEIATTLPLLHTLRVRCPAAAAGQWLTIEAVESESSITSRVPEVGIVTIDELPAGSYRVGFDDAAETVSVEIPRDAELSFAPASPIALEVELHEPRPGQGASWLERAGLRDGDRIVGLARSSGGAAEEFHGLRALQVAVLRAFSRGEGEIFLERGEGEVRITIPDEGAPSDDELSGCLRPTARRDSP